jgi:mycothiol synthase
MGFDNFVACTLRGLKPESMVLLERANRLVGVAVGHDYELESEGWIEQVAVRLEHRGEGLGRALLEESFRRFREAGRTRCGVSTDSRTGALGLYQRVGMSVVRSYTRWAKPGL